MAVRYDDPFLMGEPEGSRQWVKQIFRQWITMDLKVSLAVYLTVPYGSGQFCLMFTGLKMAIMGLLMTDQVLFL